MFIYIIMIRWISLYNKNRLHGHIGTQTLLLYTFYLFLIKHDYWPVESPCQMIIFGKQLFAEYKPYKKFEPFLVNYNGQWIVKTQ